MSSIRSLGRPIAPLSPAGVDETSPVESNAPVGLEQPVEAIPALADYYADGFEAAERGTVASQFVAGAGPLATTRAPAAVERFVDAFEPAVEAKVALTVPQEPLEVDAPFTESPAGSGPAADFVASFDDLPS